MLQHLAGANEVKRIVLQIVAQDVVLTNLDIWSTNGFKELDLQVSRNNLSVDLVLQGKFSKDGNKASGEWDAPNCHGTLKLTRKFPF